MVYVFYFYQSSLLDSDRVLHELVPKPVVVAERLEASEFVFVAEDACVCVERFVVETADCGVKLLPICILIVGCCNALPSVVEASPRRPRLVPRADVLALRSDSTTRVQTAALLFHMLEKLFRGGVFFGRATSTFVSQAWIYKKGLASSTRRKFKRESWTCVHSGWAAATRVGR